MKSKKVLLNVIKMMATNGENQKEFNPKKEVVNLVLNVHEMSQDQSEAVVKALKKLGLKRTMNNAFFMEYRNLHKLSGKSIQKLIEKLGELGLQEGVHSRMFVFKKSEMKKKQVKIIVNVVDK